MSDRVFAYSEEAEAGILGCMLVEPRQSIDSCAGKAPPSVFYLQKHQEIAEAIYDLDTARCSVDLITVSAWLRDRNKLDLAGGMGYIAKLQDDVSSVANIAYYLGIVLQKHARRRVAEICTNFALRSKEIHDGDVAELLEEFQQETLSLSITNDRDDIVPIRQLARNAIDRIQEYHARGGKTFGLATGYPDFDQLTGGLRPGQVFVVAGRPSMGKTSLAMNIAENVGAKEKISTGVFSLEMSDDELAERMTYSLSKVSACAAQKGYLNEGDFKKLTIGGSTLANSNIHIKRAQDMTIGQLRACARKMYSKFGCRLFVIDYLQLVKGTPRKGSYNRQEEVAEISRGIKAMASELKVPVILIAQLNREIEKEKKRKPRLSDLRESGAIEQDADIVGMLYHPEENPDPDSPSIQTNLIVPKQRNGPIGDIRLLFMRQYTRFESMSKIEQ